MLSAVAIGLSIIGITALVLVILLNNDLKTYQSLVDESIHNERETAELTVLFKQQVQEWKNVLLRGTSSENLDKYWGRVESRHHDIQRKGLALYKDMHDDNQRHALDEFLTTHSSLLEKYSLGRDAYIRNGSDSTAGDFAVKGIDREPTQQLIDLTNTFGAKVQADAHAISKGSQSLVLLAKIIIPLACLLLFFGIYFVIKYHFSRPLDELVKSVTYWGAGDFSVPIDTSNKNEIGIIARELDTAQRSLRELFVTVKSTAENVNDNALKIKSNSTLINQGMESTDSRIEQAATAVTEIFYCARGL